ncbi:Lrp/AsnC family transcriptional regulator [Gordonia hydrophobica]|uniref:Lrp/AsnC family transcriptional regulator n=1 Tax=Gordonia hydrophobica TaxID=40516 RepID=A0ABZ2U293_9ACTN|nr:Lrp/AsnC family transcriptional regulator [Gordonia hydrophobica]MBM7366894.1 DNA-binding Lrp family transcriptional regulator [Gordonia hydrophobica]
MDGTVEIPDLEIVRSLIFGNSEVNSTISGQEVLSDEDQLLIGAIQERPRASWQDIARAVNSSASTVARRFEKLRADGLAWVTVYPARLVATTGYCWVSVSPAARRDVTVRLAAHPATFWIEELDGDRAFFVGLGASSLRRLTQFVGEIAAMPGVTDTVLQTSRSVLHDGSLWFPRLAGTAGPHAPVWRAELPESIAHPTPQDLRMFDALMRDGRVTYVDLAAAAGVSERTVRRRLPQMFDGGLLNSRCDVSREALGMQAGILLSVRWTPKWRALIDVATRISGARLVAGTSGSAPFLLHFWIKTVGEGDRILATLQNAVPDLEVERIDYAVRTVKRYSRFFGPDGIATGFTGDVGGTSVFEVMTGA